MLMVDNVIDLVAERRRKAIEDFHKKYGRHLSPIPSLHLEARALEVQVICMGGGDRNKDRLTLYFYESPESGHTSLGVVSVTREQWENIKAKGDAILKHHRHE